MDTNKGHASSPTAVEKRKLRNRLSQKAFRERRAAYLQHLERRLGDIGKPDNEIIEELQLENTRLRQLLFECRAKLETTQATMAAFNKSLGDALGAQDSKGMATYHQGEPNQYQPYQSLSTKDMHSAVTNVTRGFSDPPIVEASDFTILGESEASGRVLSESCFETNVSPLDKLEHHPEASFSTALTQYHDGMDEFLSLTQLPGIWSHEYQMGSSAYQHAISNIPKPDRVENISTMTTNSLFSDHIILIEGLIMENWLRVDPKTQANSNILYQLASVMLSMFNGVSRPSALTWYSKTKMYPHVTNLVMWHIRRSWETYSRLHPRFRPTALQTMETYPRVIDWCPFGLVRERMIMYHSANPYLDEIISDMSTSFVVEADFSELCKSDRLSSRCYVRLWDILQAMNDLDVSSRDDPISSCELPAPNVEAIFTSKEYAYLVFKKLQMESGVAVFKLDPEFFIKYPELYDPEEAHIAQGFPIAPTNQSRIPGPGPLDARTREIYKHFAQWSFNVLCANF